MAGGIAAGKGKGKGQGKGEMRGKYSSPKAKQGRTPKPKNRLQLTRLVRMSKDEGLAPPMRKSPAKLPVKGGKGMKEASAIAKSMQAPIPLIPERRTKSASKDRQAVPRPSVGDEAEAGANNNQGVGKGREKAVPVRSQKPHEDIPAQKTQVVSNKGKEKVVSVGSQKLHEDILAEKTQGVEKGKETAGSSEDPRMEKKKGKKKPGSEKPKETGMSSEAIESQIIHEHSVVKKMQGSKKAKGKGSLVKPMEKVQVPKEVEKPKQKDASVAPNLSKASEQPMKRKLPLQAVTVGSPSKHVKVKSLAPRRVCVGYLLSEYEDTAEDSFDQLEEYEKRRLAKLTKKVKKEGKESNLVEIYDNSDEEEVKQDQEEAKDEGEEEEKSICEEGEEEEDEGGDEEGADDEEEDGEKAEEQGRESDGEKIDEGDGGTGDDKDSKDDGEGSGDDGKGDEEGIVQKARMKVMKGMGLVLAWMEVMKGTGLVLRMRRPRRHPTRRPHPSRAGVARHLG
ncbi:hypothetical protein L7F22_011713 [Adiantum nelumboides]|nr:hypothetical protein [Adiantum nelumboides]